jgi:hypothetical protein
MRNLALIHIAQSLHTELRSCACSAMNLTEREALCKAVARRLEAIQCALTPMDDEGLDPALGSTIERLRADAQGHARAGEEGFTSEILDLPAEYFQLERALQCMPGENHRKAPASPLPANVE